MGRTRSSLAAADELGAPGEDGPAVDGDAVLEGSATSGAARRGSQANPEDMNATLTRSCATRWRMDQSATLTYARRGRQLPSRLIHSFRESAHDVVETKDD